MRRYTFNITVGVDVAADNEADALFEIFSPQGRLLPITKALDCEDVVKVWYAHAGHFEQMEGGTGDG